MLLDKNFDQKMIKIAKSVHKAASCTDGRGYTKASAPSQFARKAVSSIPVLLSTGYIAVR